MMSAFQSDLEKNGFAILRSVVPTSQIQKLISALEAVPDQRIAAGMRNLLSRSHGVRDFASSGIAFGIAKDILRTDPIPVRAILFDKTPAANWYVTWHQDLSIPVQSKVEVDGFGPWSTKDNVIHVQPPAKILEKMVSLRVHLDACAERNGPIKFIAGSHLSGILETENIAQWRDNHEAVIASANSGDVIAMRPLVLHSSSIAESPEHRRVLHLEYAGVELPPELDWGQA